MSAFTANGKDGWHARMGVYVILYYYSRRKRCAAIMRARATPLTNWLVGRYDPERASLGKQRLSRSLIRSLARLPRSDRRNEERREKGVAGIEFLWSAGRPVGQSRESTRVARKRVFSLARRRRRCFYNFYNQRLLSSTYLFTLWILCIPLFLRTLTFHLFCIFHFLCIFFQYLFFLFLLLSIFLFMLITLSYHYSFFILCFCISYNRRVYVYLYP